jgi:FkbM family methyltransferase
MKEERWHEKQAGKISLATYAKGNYYCLPPDSDHRTAVKLIRKGKLHEKRTIRFINSYAGDGAVIHAGAYFGDFLPGLKKCHKVFAFEPNPESYNCALKTIELNKLTNIELTNAALGSEKGKAQFATWINGQKWGGGSRIHAGGDIEVDVVTIDETIGEERITVIHLDVEEYEVEALKGGLSTIERWKPVLILEMNHCLYGNWFRETIIEQMGYKYKKKIHNNLVFVV